MKIRSWGELPYYICWPYKGATAIEWQVGRFCVRWCYLGLFQRREPGALWRWHPFQLCRWSFNWDTSDREE
jgi:hypothetical protein